MVELLRFANESAGNFLTTVLFLMYILFLTVISIQAFKPINYTYIAKIAQKEEINNEYED